MQKKLSCSLLILWVQDKNQIDLIDLDRSPTFGFLEKAETTIYSVVCTSSLKSVIWAKKIVFRPTFETLALCMGRGHKTQLRMKFLKITKSSEFVASRLEWHLPQWSLMEKCSVICSFNHLNGNFSPTFVLLVFVLASRSQYYLYFLFARLLYFLFASLEDHKKRAMTSVIADQVKCQ